MSDNKKAFRRNATNTNSTIIMTLPPKLAGFKRTNTIHAMLRDIYDLR